MGSLDDLEKRIALLEAREGKLESHIEDLMEKIVRLLVKLDNLTGRSGDAERIRVKRAFDRDISDVMRKADDDND